MTEEPLNCFSVIDFAASSSGLSGQSTNYPALPSVSKIDQRMVWS
jgi:hypothetical protein